MRKLIKPTLWPKHQIQHLDLTRVPEPRIVYPFHIEIPDPLGRGTGTVDIVEVSRDEFLENFAFPEVEPNTYKNLQIWLNNIGPALYNPIWWMKMPHKVIRHTRYPHTIGFYNDLHGSHRCRALERLQLPCIYVCLHEGPTFVNPSNPHWDIIRPKININRMDPITYTEWGICEKCGERIKWGGPPKTGERITSGAENYKSTIYTCLVCGYFGQRPVVYPEPV